MPDVGGQNPYSIEVPNGTCWRPMISVAKPSRGVGSGAVLAGALGEAPGNADGGVDGAADAGLVADGDPDAAGELVVDGDPDADGESVAGAPLALALAVADAVPEGAGVGVGVARIDGLGVSDSTGPGVSSESQTYDLPLALWKSTKPSTRTPTTAAPPMSRPR